VLLASHSSAPVWIELKHWLIGRQKAGSYNASWYFRQQPHAPTGTGPDVDKLSTIANGEKYIVIAATAAPTQDDWQSGLEVFNRRVTENGRRVQCLTDVNTYPAGFSSGYFVSLPLSASHRKRISGCCDRPIAAVRRRLSRRRGRSARWLAQDIPVLLAPMPLVPPVRDHPRSVARPAIAGGCQNRVDPLASGDARQSAF
jgi:hypothetical protein